jgi:hypothetical protein
MKVTAEMVQAAKSILPPTHETRIRTALEAALKDVPEPGIRGASLTAIYCDEAQLFDAEKRAKAAEAKLEAIRERASEMGDSQYEDILDGED